MKKLQSALRNCVCGALASVLIALGFVRRARRRILAQQAFTPIYFHSPNAGLFLKCIDWLSGHGFHFISADQAALMLKGERQFPNGGVWLSLDDGYRKWLTDVLPLIRERRIPVTLFIPTGIIEADGLLPWLHGRAYPGSVPADAKKQNERIRPGYRETMTVPDLIEISQFPEVTIGSHSVNHAVMAYCTDDRVRFELSESKRVLESWTGKPVRYFAYPEGRFHGREEPLLRETGYVMAATTRCGCADCRTNSYYVPRFCVADDIPFPEAICNMVGVWQPVIGPIKRCVAALATAGRRVSSPRTGAPIAPYGMPDGNTNASTSSGRISGEGAACSKA